MKKFLKICVLFCSLFLVACESVEAKKTIDETTVVFLAEQLHNGDAKFYRDYIITSLDSQLSIIDYKGNVVKVFHDINANWIDSIEEEGIIAYGNFNNQIGIVKLDDENKILSNTIVLTTENLQIDPTITKIGENYYLTVTEIEGTINNSNPSVENGRYIVYLYQSKDLVEWSRVSCIVDENNNVEDVDLFYENECMYVVFEKEVLDKGNSAIFIKKSLDKGKSWDDAIILLEADCDHEPVTMETFNQGYVLYYSSDRDNMGESYMGAKAYYALYNNSFELIERDVEIQTETGKGVLWYDITEKEGKRYVLFAKDYLTDCDMVVEEEVMQ